MRMVDNLRKQYVEKRNIGPKENHLIIFASETLKRINHYLTYFTNTVLVIKDFTIWGGEKPLYSAPELLTFSISAKRCLCASDWNNGSIPDGEENDMGSI